MIAILYAGGEEVARMRIVSGDAGAVLRSTNPHHKWRFEPESAITETDPGFPPRLPVPVASFEITEEGSVGALEAPAFHVEPAPDLAPIEKAVATFERERPDLAPAFAEAGDQPLQEVQQLPGDDSGNREVHDHPGAGLTPGALSVGEPGPITEPSK